MTAGVACKARALLPAAALAAAMLASAAFAQMASTGAVTAPQPSARRSGFDFMSPQTQAMQRDDSLNPGMLWVHDGQALWSRREGANARSCAGCHGDAGESMRGVAARYPVFDPLSGRAVGLSQRINQCRESRQGAPALPAESQPMLSLESYVAHQSRGLPVAAPPDPRLGAARERGRALFEQRMGQLNLSCAQCHDANAGRRLGSSVIPQGHATGYPIYRLEWQSMGSLQRRLRNCMSGVRAEPFPFGAQELVDLEVYLNARAAGMTIETPAVRP